jgi:uncharacterized protein (DUF1778 family)
MMRAWRGVDGGMGAVLTQSHAFPDLALQNPVDHGLLFAVQLSVQRRSNAMGVKTDRMEARVSPEQRAHIERAASVVGLSVSAFIVGAAVERAEQIIAEATTTTVAADYFDELLAALDEPTPTPRLAKAAKHARRSRRIQRR